MCKLNEDNHKLNAQGYDLGELDVASYAESKLQQNPFVLESARIHRWVLVLFKLSQVGTQMDPGISHESPLHAYAVDAY